MPHCSCLFFFFWDRLLLTLMLVLVTKYDPPIIFRYRGYRLEPWHQAHDMCILLFIVEIISMRNAFSTWEDVLPSKGFPRRSAARGAGQYYLCYCRYHQHWGHTPDLESVPPKRVLVKWTLLWPATIMEARANGPNYKSSTLPIVLLSVVNCCLTILYRKL
jgi:hypothetical protein